MRVATLFAEPFTDDVSVYTATSTADLKGALAALKEKKQHEDYMNGVFRPGSAITYDHLAIKYEGKKVYVWRGERKGKVGRVISMSGPYARVSLSGTTEGAGIYAIKREYLIRYVDKIVSKDFKGCTDSEKRKSRNSYDRSIPQKSMGEKRKDSGTNR